MSETETTAKAKVTRETRVFFAGEAKDFTVAFVLPSGLRTDPVDHQTFADETLLHALQYGIKQLYQDSVAKFDGSDLVARDHILRFTSGDWSGTRSDTGPTMAKTARRLLTANKVKGDDMKAKLAKILDPTHPGYATVKAEYEKELAAWTKGPDMKALGF